jgi:hypothetical protein
MFEELLPHRGCPRPGKTEVSALKSLCSQQFYSESTEAPPVQTLIAGAHLGPAGATGPRALLRVGGRAGGGSGGNEVWALKSPVALRFGAAVRVGDSFVFVPLSRLPFETLARL